MRLRVLVGRSMIPSVTVGLIDRLKFFMDVLKRMDQLRLEMLRQGAAIAAGDDLDGASMSEAVFIRTAAAQRVVNINQMHQAGRLGDLIGTQAERVAAAVPVLVMTESDLARHLQ